MFHSVIVIAVVLLNAVANCQSVLADIWREGKDRVSLPFQPRLEKLANRENRVYGRWNGTEITAFTLPPIRIHTNFGPVNSFDSLKGKRIRVFGKPLADYISIMNGTPVMIAFAEVASALALGTVEGALVALGGVWFS